jgi:3-methylcrotonyl-CoA carboxylase alpha subunit
MFRRLLIANRGEIACRIARTARRTGLHTIAVYSDADAKALHVRMADEAVAIGPAPAAQSYLAIDRIVAAARATGAEAVHPGYGFLAENADFAQACADAGLIFVGPPTAAIRAMGSKSGAKALMEEAGVPLVPGYHGADQSTELLAREAAHIGYPVLIKPSAGGGGKGMVVVMSAADLTEALATARRVAKSAFGDDRVLIEKYLAHPRHIEVQIFADMHGNCVHLFARDCSVQRRHQKVIEEAPAPGLTPERMKAMGDAAIAAARAVGYVGAGTVEFIAEGADFAFMEMNTRLQVEHPVTEMVTGLDLVEWQLRVAAGEPLPLPQDRIAISGHAVEARIYAEDPARGFLPSTGTLIHLTWPEPVSGLRIDAGVGQGDAVSHYYDPMLAKVIAHGADRATALANLARALDDCSIFGVANNLDFLARILRHPEFAAGPVDTGFIGRHLDALAPPHGPPGDRLLATAALAVLCDQRSDAIQSRSAGSDPWSPWGRADGWRLGGAATTELRFAERNSEHVIGITYRRDGGYDLALPGGPIAARGGRDESGRLHAELDGIAATAHAVRRGDTVFIRGSDGAARLTVIDPREGGTVAAHGAGHLVAPMPGVVVSVSVAAGQSVSRGATMMVIEAMKMEHAVVAPADGTVTAVRFAAGDKVSEGQEVIAFEPASVAASAR